METYMYQAAMFDRFLNNLSRDIALTDRWSEQKKKKKEKQKQ